MFPTLCFVDVSQGVLDDESKSVLESNLNDEEMNLISEDNKLASFKFKIVELFETMKIAVANK